jgi:hypothetical protein
MFDELRSRHEINWPLHSTDIRGKRNNFAWMGTQPERAEAFLHELGELICALPAHAIACVVHRPGYNLRYGEMYGEKRWSLCKTAFSIVVERAAKIADENGRRLLVHVEWTGKKENQLIRQYHSDLLTRDSYFDASRSQKYLPMAKGEFGRILFKEPKFYTKANAAGQLSDMVVYPVVKGRYDPNYAPYREMKSAGRLIDALFDEAEAPSRGIKYSYFDGL